MSVVIASAQYWADWPNATDGAFDVRAKSNRAWVSAELEVVPAGETRVVGTGSITALRPTLPAITLPATSAGLDDQTAKWTVTLHRTGRAQVVSTVLADFPLPVSFEPSTTWAQIKIHKNGKQPLRDTSTYTKTETDYQISLAAGLLNKANASPAYGLTALDPAPASAADPEAVGTNSPYIPGFVLHTSKYASLNLAITAITALGGGTIVVDSSTPVSSNVATTATIALEFKGQGQLTGSSKTVTIVGPFDCPSGQQAFATGVTVSWTGNTVLQAHKLSWYGVTASVAADQSVNYQRAATATLTGMRLELDVLGSVRLDSTVTFLDLRNIMVVSPLPIGYSDIGLRLHNIIWYGANGGNPLRIDRVRNSLFRGIGVWGAPVAGTADGADVGVFLTQDGSGVNISTNNTFEHCTSNANSTRSGWKGFNIDNTSDSNNEQHRFSHCTTVGGNQGFGAQTGTGYFLGHPNVKDIVFESCHRIGLAKFIDSSSGSFHDYNSFGGDCGIVYSGLVTDACSIIGVDSEQDTQIMSLTGSGVAPVAMDACRFSNLKGGQAVTASTTDDPVFEIVNTISLTVKNSLFAAPGNASFTDDFIVNTSGSQSVLWEQNTVNGTAQYLLDAGLNTFGFGFASDKFGSRWFGNRNILSGVMTRPTSRALIRSVPNNPDELVGYIPAAVNSLAIGTGEIEIGGLARPNQLTGTVVGTAGSTTYLLQVLARDSLGNRTLASTLLQSVTTANATLTGSNYIQLDWPAVPDAVDYIVLQYSAGTWRIVDTVAASGTDYETYNIISNPAGAFTYVVPTYNETATLKFRGASTFSDASPIAFTPTSPAELVANTNNWNPGGTAPYASSIVRFSTDVSRNITGLTFTKTQTAGQCHLLINVGLANAVLKHQDGASAAANRFFCSTAADITLAPKQAADVIYDDINDYWLVYKRT